MPGHFPSLSVVGGCGRADLRLDKVLVSGGKWNEADRGRISQRFLNILDPRRCFRVTRDRTEITILRRGRLRENYSAQRDQLRDDRMKDAN